MVFDATWSIRFAWRFATAWRALDWRAMAGVYYEHVAALGPFEEPS